MGVAAHPGPAKVIRPHTHSQYPIDNKDGEAIPHLTRKPGYLPKKERIAGGALSTSEEGDILILSAGTTTEQSRWSWING
jgi:hypothetical protein